MNKHLIFIGIFLIIASPAGLLVDYILSKSGVPSTSDMGDKIIDSMPTNDDIKEIGRKPIRTARFLENIPWYIFYIGLFILILGLILPPF